MPNTITIGLQANGQALAITQAPPVLASDVIDLLRFEVSFSQEWEGFESYAVILKNGATVRVCEVSGGVAVADAEAIADAGALEACIMARRENARLTTERVIIGLHESGL